MTVVGTTARCCWKGALSLTTTAAAMMPIPRLSPTSTAPIRFPQTQAPGGAAAIAVLAAVVAEDVVRAVAEGGPADVVGVAEAVVEDAVPEVVVAGVGLAAVLAAEIAKALRTDIRGIEESRPAPGFFFCAIWPQA